MTRVLHFHTAGVGVDLVGAAGLVVDLLERVGSGMLTLNPPGAPVRRLVVTKGSDDTTWFEGAPLSPDPRAAAATLLSAVDRAALLASPHLAVHAAAVAGPIGAAVIPGESGSGKSTLAGACMQAGLDLLSDEAACIDAGDLRLHAHARPLGLSGHSAGLLHLPVERAPEQELATAPSLLGGCVPPDAPRPASLIVLAQRSAGGPPSLTAASAAEGLSALLRHRLQSGLSDNPAAEASWTSESSWRLLARLANSVPTARLTYDVPQDGAALLSQWLRSAVEG